MPGLRAAGRRRTRSCALAVAAAALTLASLALASSLASAASWSLVTTPNASGADHSVLHDMACEMSSTNACTAVGYSIAGGVMTPYAQYWNGTSWSNQTIANPVGATEAMMRANYCLSATRCFAAGYYRTGGGGLSLVEVWNGTNWSVERTPNPVGATDTKLEGISCAAFNECIAVGYSTVGGVRSAIAMRGSSGTWSLQTVPQPATAIAAEWYGVDCRFNTGCVAVGRYTESGGANWAMSAVWDGTSWTLQPVGNPAGARRSILLDISCSDMTNCTGVGGYYNSRGVQETLIQRWNGSGWSLQASPNPAGSSNSVLQNVSCSMRSWCVAVGDWLNGGTWTPMAQNWSSAGWALEAPPNRGGATFGLLDGVACRISCLAVGFSTTSARDSTLGVSRDTPRWTQQAISNVSLVDNYVNGIACVTGPLCHAVGRSGSTTPATRFATTGAWSFMPTFSVPAATHAELSDVSCWSSNDCLTVGSFQRGTTDDWPFAGTFSAGFLRWAYLAVTPPGGALSATLNDVACPAVRTCIAVGDYRVASGTFVFIATWNGTTWNLSYPTNVVNASGNFLRGISCASATACMAVGHSTAAGRDFPLIQRWNGSGWTIQASTLPAGGTTGRLRAVSCTAASDCLAAGSYSDGSTRPHVTRWNGTSWATQAAPRVDFATAASFEDVACTAATACTAVGSYTGGGLSRTLASQWNGSDWTLQVTPNPATTANEFRGVACASATDCRAVGHSHSGGSVSALAASLP